MDIKQRIHDTVTGNPVVLYMKGNRQFPQCGFSGVKDYANWPTVPQLYIGGEFVGGSDIMTEMYQSGELQKQLEPIVKAA